MHRENRTIAMIMRFFRGGEGVALPALSTYEAFINQLKIVCERSEAQRYSQNAKVDMMYLPCVKTIAG